MTNKGFSMPFTCRECVGYTQVLARAEDAERRFEAMSEASSKIVSANKMLMERVEELLGDDMSFDTWWEIGYEKGWVGPPVCYLHDGIPTSEEEDNELNEGHDPCLHIMRLYDGQGHKIEVEDFHLSSVWRAKNRMVGGE